MKNWDVPEMVVGAVILSNLIIASVILVSQLFPASKGVADFNNINLVIKW